MIERAKLIAALQARGRKDFARVRAGSGIEFLDFSLDIFDSSVYAF